MLKPDEMIQYFITLCFLWDGTRNLIGGSAQQVTFRKVNRHYSDGRSQSATVPSH